MCRVGKMDGLEKCVQDMNMTYLVGSYIFSSVKHSEFLSSTGTKTLFLTLQLNKDQQHSSFTTEKLLFSTLKFCQERLVCGLSLRVDQDTNCRIRI